MQQLVDDECDVASTNYGVFEVAFESRQEGRTLSERGERQRDEQLSIAAIPSKGIRG